MKKILATIAFLPLLLAGCMKLDYVESDALTSAALAANPAAAVYTTDGIYAMMKEMTPEYLHSQNNTFIRQYFLLNELKGDNIAFSYTSTDPFWKAAQYIDANNDPNISHMWFVCYKMIYAANSNINGLVETDTPSEQNQLKGENYFLRAFFHFTLCTIYAKPYHFDDGASPGVVLRIGTDYSKTERASVAECYDAIEKDLKEAIRLMDPSTKRGDNGYASQEAAHALLGRLYLYKGDWDGCIAECDAILGNAPASHLENEVTDVYSKATTSKEVLWCVDITDADLAGIDPKGNLASMFDSPDGTQGTGWGELYVADPLLDLFERYPQDKRYKDMIRLHNPQPGIVFVWGEEDSGSLIPSISYPNVNPANGNLSSSVTDNGDGTYSFSKNGTNYTAKLDNTATKISDDFPGYILNDGRRCYKRSVMPTPALDANNSPTWGGAGCSMRTTGGDFLTWFCSKFSHDENIKTVPISSSYIMIRYAEVILNRAEAYAHKGGNDDKALADINVIRTRAGLTGAAQMTAGNLAGRGYPAVIDAVLDERRMELYYEGFRVHDLLRNHRDIDRRYPSFTKSEVVPYTFSRIQYHIPKDESDVSGIPDNIF